jgi:hypothetical protein
MPNANRNRVVVTQAAWMVVALAALVALGRFLVETYFVVSFIGLLVAIQLFAPPEERPACWRPIRLLVVVCFLVFGYLVYLRFAAIV